MANYFKYVSDDFKHKKNVTKNILSEYFLMNLAEKIYSFFIILKYAQSSETDFLFIELFFQFLFVFCDIVDSVFNINVNSG